MFIKKIIPVIFILFIAVSCSKNDKETKDTKARDTTKVIETDKTKKVSVDSDSLFDRITVQETVFPQNVNEKFYDHLEDVFNHYIAIKDELSDNDSVDSKKHAYELLESVSEASRDAGNQLESKWVLNENKMLQYKTNIDKSVSLKEQRDWFSKLSASLTEAIEKYGLPDETIYELSSAGSQGQKWLSDKKNVDNPYTGDNSGKGVKVIRGWSYKK